MHPLTAGPLGHRRGVNLPSVILTKFVKARVVSRELVEIKESLDCKLLMALFGKMMKTKPGLQTSWNVQDVQLKSGHLRCLRRLSEMRGVCEIIQWVSMSIFRIMFCMVVRYQNFTKISDVR